MSNTIGYSLPSCTPPIGGGSVTLATVSMLYTPTLIGFSEYVDPSSPPKKYRLKTTVLNTGYRGVYDFSCAGPLFGSDSAVFYGQESYSALTGAFTTTARLKILQNFGSIPPTHVLSDGPVTFPTVPYVSTLPELVASSGKTFTQAVWDPEGCYYESSTGKWYNYFNNFLARFDLSDEDTETDAVARAVPTVGTEAVALRTARTTGFSFLYRTVDATLHCLNLRSEFRYRVSYDLKEVNLDTSQETLTPYEVDIPEFSTSYDIDVALAPDSGFSLELVNYNISTR